MAFKINSLDRLTSFLERQNNSLPVTVVNNSTTTLFYDCCCRVKDIYYPCQKHIKWAQENTNSKYLLNEQ